MVEDQININNGPELCPCFKFFAHFVFDIDAHALDVQFFRRPLSVTVSGSRTGVLANISTSSLETREAKKKTSFHFL